MEINEGIRCLDVLGADPLEAFASLLIAFLLN